MTIQHGRRVGRFIALIGGGVVIGVSAFLTSFGRVSADEHLPATVSIARPDYRNFQHKTKAHKMDCSSCHKFPSTNWNKVRTGSDAFPDITEYPRHESCLSCHKAQFFKGRPPAVCSICHTSPGPRNSTRHPFPNPRELFDQSTKAQKAPDSDFLIAFPHDKHIDIVSQRRSTGPFAAVAFRRAAAEESCAVCHKTYLPQGDSKDEFVTPPPKDLGDAFWLKRGTFKTTPIGHTTCFTCHSVDSGMEPAPANCGQCHKLRPAGSPADFDPKSAARMKITDRIMLTQWRHRISAGTFRHEFEMHAGMECATCHTVSTMNILDEKTRKVPIASCGTCHATASVDDGGALNYEVDKRSKDPAFTCVKCHVAYGRLPVPQSHTAALEAAK